MRHWELVKAHDADWTGGWHRPVRRLPDRSGLTLLHLNELLALTKEWDNE